MNTTSHSRNAADPFPPVGAGRDFVAVDDSGEFSYYGSEQELMAAFEYAAEAACIIDRSCSTYRLVLDRNRHLKLVRSLGAVEFRWLRQAWLEAQNAHPEHHRLRRFFPLTAEEVVSDLFETLVLEHGDGAPAGPWTLVVNGIESHPPNLKDIDQLLAHQNSLEQVDVEDPFGHIYRPSRHHRNWYLPAHAGFILYIEIPQGKPL